MKINKLEIKGKDDLLILRADLEINKKHTNISALDVYEIYCQELGIDPEISKGSFNSDDASWFFDTIISLDAEFLFSHGFNYSSEAGLGLYNIYPSNTARRDIASAIPNVSRMYTTNSLPMLFFTFRPTTQDLRSENTRWNENEKGFCIYAQHRRYNATTDQFRVAIQVTDREIKFYFEQSNGTGHRLYLNVFEGNDTTNTTLYNQYHLTNIFSDSQRTEVTINLGREYHPKGEFIYSKDVSNVKEVTSSYMNWEQDIPEGTSAVVSTALVSSGDFPTEQNWIAQPIEQGNILSILDAVDLTGKKLFIKVQLETSILSETPSISNIEFELRTPTDLEYIHLEILDLERFNNVEGELTVKYDASKGNLSGAGGRVSNFEVSFVPTGLEQVPNPYNIETILIQPVINLSFTKVDYGDIKTTGDTINVSNSIVVNLIHTEIINP